MIELGNKKRMYYAEVVSFKEAKPNTEIPNGMKGYGLSLKANYKVGFKSKKTIAITTFGKSLESDKNPGQFRQDAFWVIEASVTMPSGAVLQGDISDATFRRSVSAWSRG